MGRKKKVLIPPPPIIPKKIRLADGLEVPGQDSAVVYEDRLPWDSSKGICFEIWEGRQWRIHDNTIAFCWRIPFLDGRPNAEWCRAAPTEIVMTDSGYLDTIRADARRALLQAAHDRGII